MILPLRSDRWIAAGAAACVALGVCVTGLLMRKNPISRPARSIVARGELINSKPDPLNGIHLAKSENNLPQYNGEFLTVSFDTLGSFRYEFPKLAESRTFAI